MDSQQCEISHVSPARSNPLKLTLVIVAVIMAVEIIGGVLSNSLALLGDAGHMLTDVMALLLSLIALQLAVRPPSMTKTFFAPLAYKYSMVALSTSGSV
jgi:cobalt-zinc-cadmium efflux system protein